MKKIITLLSVVIFSHFFIACENPFINNVLKPMSVTFETNGGSPIKSQFVLKGDRIIRPNDPVKTANEFVGWYRESALINEWFFDTIPVSNITLYAKWDDSGITLSPSGSMDLGIKIAGYDPFDENSFIVTVFNSSIVAPTGELILELSGDNDDSFVISRNLIDNIPAYGKAEFSVIPKTGLPIGNHTAVLTVRGNEEINEKISASLNLSFLVIKDVKNMKIDTQPNLEYVYGIPLNLSGLTVSVEYSDGSTDTNLSHSAFASSYFTTVPAHGDIVSVLNNNEHPVRIFWAGRYIMDTDNLIVRSKPVTIGATVYNKIYDGKIDADCASTVVNGVLAGDNVFAVIGTASFEDKNAGDNKTVTFKGFSISGDSAGNYNLPEQPASTTAAITQLRLIIGSPNVTTSKIYDGTTEAVAVIGAPQNIVQGDAVNAAIVSALYNSPDVSSAYQITVVYSISGADAGNYMAPVNYVVSGNITRASINVTTWPSGMTAIYGQTLSQVAIPNNGAAEVAGSFSWTSPSTQVTSTGLQSYSMTFTPSNNNYLSLYSMADVIVSSAPITRAAITVTEPVARNVPNTTAQVEPGSNFYVTSVTWTPADERFIAIEKYTVNVTLQTANYYTFTNGLTVATINGQAATVVNNGSTATLSYLFLETKNSVERIEIKEQPKLIYDHGTFLDLSSLVVALIKTDTTKEDVPYDKIPDYYDYSTGRITINMDNNYQLRRTVNNNTFITVSYSNSTTGVTVSANTNNIVVNYKKLTIAGVEHYKYYDGGTAAEYPLVILNGKESFNGYLDDVNAGTVTANYTSAAAGTRNIRITAVTLEGMDADNYVLDTVLPATFPTPQIMGILKADGPEASAPTWNSSLISGSSITANANTPITGQTFQYAINNQYYADNLKEEAWVSNRTFTEFNGKPFTNETYYLFARSSSTNNNYNVGQSSVASEPITFYRVKFNSNVSGGNFPDVLILSGEPLPVVSIPIKQGYYMEGFYRLNNPFRNKWDFDAKETVQGNITLYANWTANPNIRFNYSGGVINLTSGSENIIIYKSDGIGKPTEITFTLDNSGSVTSILWNYDNYSLASNKAVFTLNASNSAVETGGKSIQLTVNGNVTRTFQFIIEP